MAADAKNPTYIQCTYTTTCEADKCTPIADTCAADTINPPCSVRYPGDPSHAVEHHDNCYDPVTGRGIGCGPACGPTPGVGGPCVTDCSGSNAVCANIWYNDPTGCGRCLGTKACVGTLTAQSFSITSADTSCTAIAASSTSLPGTTFSFTPAVNPAQQTQTDISVSWTNVRTDGTTNYSLVSSPVGPYALGNVCVSQNGGALVQAAAGTLTDGGTLSFRVGYIPQMGWFQTAIGNVYASIRLSSSIPNNPPNPYPYLSLVGPGGTAGVVTFGLGAPYDFSLSSTDLGEDKVSPNNWLVQQTYPTINYYERFSQKLTNETKTEITTELDNLTQHACSTSPCILTITGDVSTAANTPWTISANEQIILLVNGNVTINSDINIINGGFFAMIVNGNITVSPNVGGLASSASPYLEGVFFATNASHTATFSSGASTTVGHERLNITGSVIADNFSLQRDLGVDNDTTPAESFIFNPKLLFTMPDVMKEAPYVWQEVAP
jgi:hypothetical protein